MEEIDAESLDKVLSVLLRNSKEYEPDSLRVMQNSLYRYFSEIGYNKSILKDQIFNESRKILEGKARLLWEQGVGKKKNASKAIDSGEEDILWNYRKLGNSSSTSTGCQEHTSTRIKNFAVSFVISMDVNTSNF